VVVSNSPPVAVSVLTEYTVLLAICRCVTTSAACDTNAETLLEMVLWVMTLPLTFNRSRVLSTTIAGPGVVVASDCTSLLVNCRPSLLTETVVVMIDRKPRIALVSRKAQLSTQNPGAEVSKKQVAIDRKLPMKMQLLILMLAALTGI